MNRQVSFLKQVIGKGLGLFWNIKIELISNKNDVQLPNKRTVSVFQPYIGYNFYIHHHHHSGWSSLLFIEKSFAKSDTEVCSGLILFSFMTYGHPFTFQKLLVEFKRSFFKTTQACSIQVQSVVTKISSIKISVVNNVFIQLKKVVGKMTLLLTLLSHLLYVKLMRR